MRVNPTQVLKKKKKEALQIKTNAVTRKVAIGFVIFILVALFLKMLLPSSVE